MSWWEREFWGKSLSSRLPQTYTPTIVKLGNLELSSVNVLRAKYWRIPFVSLAWISVAISGTTASDGGGSALSELQFSLPPSLTSAGDLQALGGYVFDGTVMGAAAWVTGSSIRVKRADAANYGLGTGRGIRVAGIFEVN
jgi:hypothetical protein